jgi:proteasome assembly chaperone (PAC2) family protein
MSDRDPRDPDAVWLSWQDADNLADAEPPELVQPMVVAAFEGWNDAGDAASTALEHLELSWDATPLAAMDPDDYYDFQVTRPTVHLVDGITRRIEWPTTRLSVCRPPGADHDVVLLRGIEPNMRWRGFCSELLTYLRKLDVTTVVTLGALLTDTPHTRPVPVSGTAYDAESAARFGLETSRYQGNTGIVGVFQDACVRAGIPAISFWAAVPHYVSQAPDPKAAVALLHRVEEVLDLEVPLGGLPEQAEAWERTVSEMADADDEVREYVRSLEERSEEESELPETSGETIAADFERYLRRRGGGSGGPGRPGGGRGGPGR